MHLRIAGENAAAYIPPMPTTQGKREREMADKVDVQVRICWSSDGETFNADSLAELLEGDDSLEAGQVVYFGEVCDIDSEFVCADDVIDMIANRAYEECGEWAEDFPRLTSTAAEELDSFLTAWQDKHCTPTFWRVEKAQEYRLVATDFDDASLAGAAP